METIFQVAFDLKMKSALGIPHPYLAGKTLGMIFADDSLRHRLSFEAGMTQLGGHAQFLDPEKLHLVHSKETWGDTIRVASRYLDGIMIRLSRVPPDVRDLTHYGAAFQVQREICEYSSVPVISAFSEVEHPCQVMANVMTIMEKLGPDYRKKKVALVWGFSKLRFAPSCQNSMAIAAGALGMTLTYAYPEGFSLDPVYLQEGKRLAKSFGGRIEVVDNIREAVEGASAIYVSPQVAIGKPLDESEAMRAKFKEWQVRPEHFELAAPEAVFMHDGPMRRGEEVTREVADGSRSVIFDQAENSLHVQKAIMALTM
jgi:ornithine carbamoyltransferase